MLWNNEIKNKLTSQKKHIKLLLVVAAYLLVPYLVGAETLNSTNYKIWNPELDAGGTASSSTNYKSTDEIGGAGTTGTSSTNFNAFPGFILPVHPNLPGRPTFSNTGGNLYNSLDFVINTDNNASDVNYAVAISKDNFVTTYYIQANDTLGSSPVWQTYASWGGASGQRIIQLEPSTSYSLKVKARYGANSETGFGPTATASTLAAQLTFTVSGVASGTSVAGATTNVATTSGSVAFPTLSSGSIMIAAQNLSVSTNATGGYTVTIQEDHDLQKTSGTTIPPVVASNSAPASWPTGITAARFGYHTTDSSLCTGTTNRFSVNDTFAAVTTSPAEVSCFPSAVTSDQTSIVYKLEVEGLQPPGDYANAISYIVTASY